MSVNTIVLRGKLAQYHEERRASGILSPGHLLKIDSDGKVLKHATVGGRSTYFAKEDPLAGKTVDGAFAVGDLVPYHVAQPGDRIQARLPAGAAAVVIGNTLISNGDGCLVKSFAAAQQLYASTAASAAITATATETAFDKTYTFAADQLKVGDVIKIYGQVIATATNSTDTLTVKVYFGNGLSGTAIGTSGALDVANNDICIFDITLIIRTVGATGTFVASGFITIGVPGTATVKTYAIASTTFDSTGTMVVTPSATWSSTNAGNSCRLDALTVSQENIAASAGQAIAVASEAVDNSAEEAEAFIAVIVA